MSKIPIEIYNILLKSNAEVLMTHGHTDGQLSLRLCLWSVSMSELKLENHLKTTESKSVPMLRQYIKWSENDWVSDLVQLLWDNIFAKNDWVSDFSRHSGFQSKMLKKRQSLRFGSITMG